MLSWACYILIIAIIAAVPWALVVCCTANRGIARSLFPGLPWWLFRVFR